MIPECPLAPCRLTAASARVDWPFSVASMHPLEVRADIRRCQDANVGRATFTRLTDANT
jgi:hypothetical protein